MSDPHTAPAPAKPFPWFSFLAILGCFAIFLLILFLAYLPNRPQPLVENDGKTPAQRLQTLEEMRAKEASALSSYGWIDQSAGVVRLPIDRAMQLEVREINAARAQRK